MNPKISILDIFDKILNVLDEILDIYIRYVMYTNKYFGAGARYT